MTNESEISKHLGNQKSNFNAKKFYVCCLQCKNCRNINVNRKGWWSPVCEGYSRTFYCPGGKGKPFLNEKCRYYFEYDLLYGKAFKFQQLYQIYDFLRVAINNGFALYATDNGILAMQKTDGMVYKKTKDNNSLILFSEFCNTFLENEGFLKDETVIENISYIFNGEYINENGS